MRQKSHDLQYLEVLYQRGVLTIDEEKEYWKSLRGYQGEVQCDQLCDYFLCTEFAMMDDVTLQLGKSVTQIDKLIAEEKVLWNIDIKNYQGNYRYENSCWTVNENIPE
ncbi:nuclease-related domain-containing protein [Tetragenococcus halophilus]|uniref:nuclease-related domain-containing protein n=1 Tax=Tetragenococcus halophilus TaxID=51669 RepID=UPI0030EA5D3B